MDPLDELREALKKKAWQVTVNYGEVVVAIDDVNRIIDAYAAAHPGLVDLTTCGPACPAWHMGSDDTSGRDWCTEGFCGGRVSLSEAPTDQPCPVLAKRGA